MGGGRDTEFSTRNVTETEDPEFTFRLDKSFCEFRDLEVTNCTKPRNKNEEQDRVFVLFYARKEPIPKE